MINYNINQKLFKCTSLAELQPLILEDISPCYIATKFVSLSNERQIHYEHFI